MSNRRFYILLAFATLFLNAYPLCQFVKTGGLLYYTNAFDETSYLQYDFSVLAQTRTRAAQYLVTFAHNMGLSGGAINLLFDFIAIGLCPLFASWAFVEAGFDRRTANLNAFLLTFLPLAFGGLNPSIQRLFSLNLSTGAIYWVTMPEASFLPLVRSPEPQFSLTLLSIAAYFSLKRKSFLYTYLCVPFMYPFVALPVAFIVVSLHVRQIFRRSPRWLPMIPLAAFFAITVPLWLYLNNSITTSDATRAFLVPTHLPLISFTAGISLVIVLFAFREYPPTYRFVAAVVALAPLAVANQQVITGWLAQPNNFEQYAGVFCATFVTLMAVRGRWVGTALVVTALVLVVHSSYLTFQKNELLNQKLVLTDELLEQLRTDSPHVAINDVELAAVCSLMFPRQPPTMFGMQKTFLQMCSEEYVHQYLCSRSRITADESLANDYRKVLEELDHGYRHEWTDFVLSHIGRRSSFDVNHPIEDVPFDRDFPELHFVKLR